MTETVIQNEAYLTTEYLDRKAITAHDINIIGRHPLVGCIGAAVKSRGAACHAYADLDEMLRHNGEQPTDSPLWYVPDLSEPNLNELKRIVQACRESQRSLLCIIPLKNIRNHTAIHRYAEMELLTAMEKQLSPIREILGSYPERTKAIVLDRLIGAQFDDVGLSGILRAAQNHGAVTVSQDMASRHISFLYLPDAISAILTVGAKGNPGNLYLASSFCMSEFEFRSKLYTMLAPHGVKLNVADGDKSVGIAALDNGKLRSLGWEPVCTLDEVLRYTIPACTDRFDIQSDYICDSYAGKLPILRRIQLDILREIDRICRAHGIKYFLSGGSMLGAVRHGGYIPWDDDIDVAFLREEYNRFKTVAPAELNESFSYQSWTNGDGYHYFFDRVTAKNTYFASKYSDSYAMPKGVSVDIFVYDTVPDGIGAQRRHWKRLMNKRLLMNVRWRNEPRGEGKARLISGLLLPLLRLKSMDSYSASYDKATRKYEKSRTNTVMAPATDHNWHDCMPREWFDEVVLCRFEDVDTFLPKGYDGFLRNWYGESYKTMLPLSKQQPYHDYYRLDVGSYADEGADVHFDYFGELK